MSDIPEQQALTPEQAFERLQVWFGMHQQLGDLRTAEVLARKTLAAYYFPEPAEGTNRLDVGLGYDLKMDYKINRDVDEAALMGLDAKALKLIEKLQIPMGDLFYQKWQLKTGAYRTLNDAQRKFVDGLLTIKEGTPALSIVPVADTAGQAKHKAEAEAAVAATQAPFPYDVNLGAEEDTAPGQYFRDGEGVWWLLDTDEWAEVTTMATLEELETYWVGATTKPKKTRKPRAKAGTK